jgi:hypothetical protein
VTASLSKSRYLIGLQCSKRLWWTVNEPDAPELAGETNAVALDRGRQVGELARTHVPGGVLIDMPPWEIDSRVAATAKALADGASVVYEASFRAGGGFASVDILERGRRGFSLIEVKSTLDVKTEHLPDVALQTHVLTSAGLDVKHIEVMHLNRECRHPDLSNLFKRERVTADVLPLLPEVPVKLAELSQVLAGPLPAVEPGPHCDAPYACPFKGRCWPEQPRHHVSTLYRIRAKKVMKLTGAGYETLHDLPEDYKASGPAKRQIRSAQAGEMIVEGGLAQALAKLKDPIAFLDFETIIPAVPAWPGCGPYNQVPVQLSCHVLAGGALQHHEWLADGPGDPRKPFAEALIAACEGAETIVAYNASFEIQRIDALIERFPELARPLKRIRKRVVDLLPIVRDNVYHPAFGGSFSLKAVLPALVPDLGYDDLDVKDGGTASALLEALLLGGDSVPAGERPEVRRKLLAYCERDTLAMVRLYERLLELAGRAKPVGQVTIPATAARPR